MTFKQIKPLSPYQQHKQKWINCQLCSLCNTRTKVCLARGNIPADILIIGEAPGSSEDIFGQPFMGPAGHLLNGILQEALQARFSIYLTNIVACMPVDEDNTKTAEPDKASIKACRPRLIEIIRIVKPKAIVLAGKLAEATIKGQADFADQLDHYCSWLPKGEYIKFTKILHPAAIIRMDVSQKSLAIKRCIAILEDLAGNLIEL